MSPDPAISGLSNGLRGIRGGSQYEFSEIVIYVVLFLYLFSNLNVVSDFGFIYVAVC